MANSEHLALLKQGIEVWNKWRQANPSIQSDLRWADLSGVKLRGVNLRGTNLSWTHLSGADLRGTHLRGSDLDGAYLSGADLRGTNLSGANLSRTHLSKADLSGANLGGANLDGADLRGTNLSGANLGGANLNEALLAETVFANVNLAEAENLDTCRYEGPSILDIRTLQQSGTLPLAFLRGCGLPDLLIDYLPSLLNQPIQYYSSFISYSSKDEDFAQRLYTDLQNKGVRCWYAPKDTQGGREIYKQIWEAIQLHEKLLMLLSEHSMKSEWIKTEIAKARQREVREKRQVLFPIRLVDFETIQQWECFDAETGKDLAREIRKYFISDFSNWKSHDAYQQALDRLLQDLKPALERKPETT